MNALQEKNIVRRFGKNIFKHILILNHKDHYGLVHIDEDLYSRCYKELNITKEQLEESFKNVFLNYKYHEFYDSQKIALVAFQIYQAYIIEQDEDLSNSYNARLYLFFSISPARLNHQYELWDQDRIWADVQILFRKNGLNLSIPEPKRYKGRYVQYPLSQLTISNIQVLKYSKEFIKRKLYPEHIYDYKTFKELLFNVNNSSFPNKNSHIQLSQSEYHECCKKRIFNFFCMWNGKDLTSHHAHNARPELKNDRKNTNCVSLVLNQGTISIFKYSEDLRIEIQYDKWLSVFKNKDGIIQNLFYYDDQYCDWIARNTRMRQKFGVLFLSGKTKHNKFEEFCEVYSNEIIQHNAYKFAIFNDYTDKVQKELNKFIITRDHRIPLKFLGGIKINSHEWLSIALPIIEYKNQEYIYIDNKIRSLKYNRIDLNRLNLDPGEHYINAYNLTPIKFIISDISINHDYGYQSETGWIMRGMIEPINENPDLIGCEVRIQSQDISKESINWKIINSYAYNSIYMTYKNRSSYGPSK